MPCLPSVQLHPPGCHPGGPSCHLRKPGCMGDAAPAWPSPSGDTCGCEEAQGAGRGHLEWPGPQPPASVGRHLCEQWPFMPSQPPALEGLQPTPSTAGGAQPSRPPALRGHEQNTCCRGGWVPAQPQKTCRQDPDPVTNGHRSTLFTAPQCHPSALSVHSPVCTGRPA